MYKIRFDSQPSQLAPDMEHDSIQFTKEEYDRFPVLPFDTFDEKCEFSPVIFCEQIRHPEKEFLAVQVLNPDWKLTDEHLASPHFYWYFVCLDKDIWVAFKWWDAADWGEAYSSTVSVSEPRHGEIYRLDKKCKEICDKLYK